jgi:hypothetical protein
MGVRFVTVDEKRMREVDPVLAYLNFPSNTQ